MPTTNTLTWNKSPDAGGGYNVYRRIGSAPLVGDLKINSGLVPVATPTYIDIVSVDGDYFYGVTYVNVNGVESGFSNIVDKVVNTTAPPPQPPTGLIVV